MSKKKKRKEIQKRKQQKAIRNRRKKMKKATATNHKTTELSNGILNNKEDRFHSSNLEKWIRYAQPVLEKIESYDPVDFRDAMKFSRSCWFLGITEDEKEQARIKDKLLVSLPTFLKNDDAEQFIQEMVARQYQFFQDLKRNSFFNDVTINQDESLLFFDEKQLRIVYHPIPADENEIKVISFLKMIDSMKINNIDTSGINMHRFMTEISTYYSQWCLYKGINEDTADMCASCTKHFLESIYMNDRPTLKTVHETDISEYISELLPPGNTDEIYLFSHIPKALELLYRFLKEKDYMSNPGKIYYMIKGQREHIFAAMIENIINL